MNDVRCAVVNFILQFVNVCVYSIGASCERLTIERAKFELDGCAPAGRSFVRFRTRTRRADFRTITKFDLIFVVVAVVVSVRQLFRCCWPVSSLKKLPSGLAAAFT